MLARWGRRAGHAPPPPSPCAEYVLATRTSADLPAPVLPCWSRTHLAMLATCPSLPPPGRSPLRLRLRLVACPPVRPPVRSAARFPGVRLPVQSAARLPGRPPARSAARQPGRPSILPTGSLPARSSTRQSPSASPSGAPPRSAASPMLRAPRSRQPRSSRYTCSACARRHHASCTDSRLPTGRLRLGVPHHAAEGAGSYAPSQCMVWRRWI